MTRSCLVLPLLALGAWQIGCRHGEDARELQDRAALRSTFKRILSSRDDATAMAPADREYHKEVYGRAISILDRYSYAGARIPPTLYMAVLEKKRAGTESREIGLDWVDSGSTVLGASFGVGERSFRCTWSDRAIASLNNALKWSVDRCAFVAIYRDPSDVPKGAPAGGGPGNGFALVAPELLEAITADQSITVQLILKDGSLTNPALEVHKWRSPIDETNEPDAGAGQSEGPGDGNSAGTRRLQIQCEPPGTQMSLFPQT